MKKVEWNGYVGREAVRKPQMGRGNTGGIKLPGQKVRMFLVKNTLVSIEINWSDKSPSDETVKKLFDSFKFELVEKVEALNGTWVIQAVVDNGKENDSVKGQIRLALSPNQMVTIKPDGTRGREVEIRMHGGGVKGAIDVRSGGPKGFRAVEWEEGIYKLEGDVLTLCMSLKRGSRPKSITDTENTSIIRMKREKAK